MAASAKVAVTFFRSGSAGAGSRRADRGGVWGHGGERRSPKRSQFHSQKHVIVEVESADLGCPFENRIEIIFYSWA